jgi:hypothetical protein
MFFDLAVWIESLLATIEDRSTMPDEVASPVGARESATDQPENAEIVAQVSTP